MQFVLRDEFVSRNCSVELLDIVRHNLLQTIAIDVVVGKCIGIRDDDCDKAVLALYYKRLGDIRHRVEQYLNLLRKYIVAVGR